MPFEQGHKKQGGRTKRIPNRLTKEMRSVLKDIVTLAGFEPATSRAEICHSIQLNYRAKVRRS